MTSSKLKTEFYAEINAIRIKAYNIHNRVKIVTKKGNLGKLDTLQKIDLKL